MPTTNLGFVSFDDTFGFWLQDQKSVKHRNGIAVYFNIVSHIEWPKIPFLIIIIEKLGVITSKFFYFSANIFFYDVPA